MRSKSIEQSILRRAVGAILSSSLSSREIIDFSNELVHSPNLAYDLAQALRMSMQVLDVEPVVHFEPLGQEPPWLPLIVDRIQKSKLPKRAIIELLPQRHIGHISPMTQQKMSLKELLLRAFENASQSTINSFIRKIGVESEPDPYLTGIEKKN